MKLYILGQGNKYRINGGESTGKDYCSEFIAKYFSLKYEGSSWYCCRKFMYDILKDRYQYKTIEECFADRHSEGMRKVWFDEICKWNNGDLAKLSREIFSENDLYCGIRSVEEYNAARKEMDIFSIYIDASDRVEGEDSDSCTITADDCDIIISNNGTLKEFETKLRNFCKFLANF